MTFTWDISWRYLKPGRVLGIATPGVFQEFSSGMPEPLKPYWEWDYCSFHSPAWWRRHWEKTGIMNVEFADSIPDGWKHWLKWQEVKSQQGFLCDAKETELLQVDAGRSLGFLRVLARKIT
jgi:hypothetical protein